VGYTETAVNISERAGVAQLHVSISVPEASVTIDNSVSFYLLVNTSDNTTTGWCMFTVQDTTKPGLWTLDWTMDWTLDSIMGLDNWNRFSIVRGQRLPSSKVMMFLVL